MNIVDVIILLALLSGTVIGLKKGLIKSVVSCIGTILVLILSFYLKNPISVFFYTYLPFFNTSISAINILIYEGIAFLVVFSVLSALLRVLIKVSGFLEFLLKLTIFLSIPSKILGALFGFLEYYVFTFLILFVLASLNINNDLIENSKFADKILSNTPIISDIADNSYNAIKDFTTIVNNNSTTDAKNEESVKILLKYNIISEENLEKLNKKSKFNIKNLESIINNYQKEKKND